MCKLPALGNWICNPVAGRFAEVRLTTPPMSDPPSFEPSEMTARLSRVRAEMVDLIEHRGVSNPRVLKAMRALLRHELVPPKYRDRAYDDRPWPIGHEQTISQPYIVAFMSEATEIEPGEKVLEIGTGSGYQAAVLAAMGARVFSIEIVEALATGAKRDLERLGISGVTVKHGDGYAGWPSEAPFNAIVVTAAPEMTTRCSSVTSSPLAPMKIFSQTKIFRFSWKTSRAESSRSS